MKKNRWGNGLTLIELMTVIAITTIISGIAIPNYIEWSRAARLRSASNDMASDLRMARLRAIKSSTAVKVVFTSQGYTIFIDNNKNHVLDSGEELLRDKQYPAGITMSSITFHSNRAIFHPTGATSPGAVTISRGGSKQIKVIVNMFGRIRIKAV